MNASELRLHRISDASDPLFLPWLDLFQTAFPPHEQIQFSRLLGLLNADAPDVSLVAALVDGKFAGMALYERRGDVAALWYLAVCPEHRSQGIGAKLYKTIIKSLDCVRAVVYEIERPDQMPDETQRRLAERRMEFYRRMGGRIALNLRFWMSVGDWQPRTLMYLVIHQLQPISVEDVLRIFYNLFPEGIEPLSEPLVLK